MGDRVHVHHTHTHNEEEDREKEGDQGEEDRVMRIIQVAKNIIHMHANKDGEMTLNRLDQELCNLNDDYLPSKYGSPLAFFQNFPHVFFIHADVGVP